MIRQRDFSSLRPLIFAICVVYLLVTVGCIALTFTLNRSHKVHGGLFECVTTPGGHLQCLKPSSSTVIQVLIWIESLLLLPIIILCMLTLWARSIVERLPGNTAFAIPGSLILMFVLQVVFLIIFLAKGHIAYHWQFDLALFLQSLFALPIAYLFFNLPQINGDSEPPYLRDDRQNLLKNASNRDKNAPGSSTSSKRVKPKSPTARAPPPTSATATEQPVSGTGTGTGTGSREEDGGKEPLPSTETIPVAPKSDPAVTATEHSRKADRTDKSGKPAAQSGDVAPPARELEDSESKKKPAKPEDQLKSKSSVSNKSKSSVSDRLKHTKIIIPPKSKTRSSRSGV